jgi:hypothetical protein
MEHKKHKLITIRIHSTICLHAFITLEELEKC